MNVALRAKAILAEPSAIWTRVESEPGDAAYFLAELRRDSRAGPGCLRLRRRLHCRSRRARRRPGPSLPILDGLFGAVFGYVVTCATVLVLGLMISLLAPAFGGRRSFDSAFKLAVYSYTPVWLAGIFLLAPGLRFLELTGFYGAYILWTGLPRLIKLPERKVPGFTALIVASAGVLTLMGGTSQRTLFGPVPF